MAVTRSMSLSRGCSVRPFGSMSERWCLRTGSGYWRNYGPARREGVRTLPPGVVSELAQPLGPEVVEGARVVLEELRRAANATRSRWRGDLDELISRLSEGVKPRALEPKGTRYRTRRLRQYSASRHSSTLKMALSRRIRVA